jgi:hypothetical protein
LALVLVWPAEKLVMVISLSFAINYQSSLSFELSDACQIEETKYILVINYISHTEYLKLDLSDNSYSTFEMIFVPQV